MSNSAVITTNDDASQCKRYAVHQQYWKDNFIQHFVKKLPERKAPEINRGYYIRHTTINDIVLQFLAKSNLDCQIISFGAGFDTLYWRLHETNKLPKNGFYEFDLKPVVQKKCYLIQSNSHLKNLLTDAHINIQNASISSQCYYLTAVDITNVDELRKALLNLGIDMKIPTLFLAECLFVYLPHDSTSNILKYIADEFQNVIFLDYDPVNLGDRFGEVMKQNLRGRQCNLVGAHMSLTSKKAMYKSFDDTKVKLLYDIYMNLDQNEKSRIEKLEFLDEVDLLYELLRHYCICIAYKQTENFELDKIQV